MWRVTAHGCTGTLCTNSANGGSGGSEEQLDDELNEYCIT